jgi:hypothetical protein
MSCGEVIVVFTPAQASATRNSHCSGDRNRRSDPAEVRLCGGDSAGHGNRFSSVGSENLETSAGALGVYLYP